MLFCNSLQCYGTRQRERGVLNFVTAVGIALSPLCFAVQNIGERPKERQFLRRGVRKVVRLYCLTPPSLRATSPIWLRHTEEEFKVTLYSFATSRGRGYFTPLLYMANTVLRNAMGHVREERDISSINTDTMAFSTPPSLCDTSPIQLTPHPVMLRGTAMEESKNIRNAF